MERWLTRVWYEGGPGGAWLRPLAALFALGSAARRLAYRAGWQRPRSAGRPVIVVGNLTVGGTGKTPLVVWLVGALREAGHSVAVVTRGYGRAGQGLQVVAPGSSAASAGDEALLIARRTGVPVVVGRDRVAAARRAVELGADVIVADDGLQHLRLARDFEIVVVDGARGFGNGRLLPAGPLRELPGRLESVGAIVLNGGEGAPPAWPADASPAGASLGGRSATAAAGPLRVRMRLVPGALRALGGGEQCLPLERLSGQAVHAVAGIGHPARFFATLRGAGLEPIEHPFPDHHAYTARELDFPGALPIVMTEKDAVKCGGFGLERAWYLPVSAEIDGAEALLGRIAAALGATNREA